MLFSRTFRLSSSYDVTYIGNVVKIQMCEHMLDRLSFDCSFFNTKLKYVQVFDFHVHCAIRLDR